MQIDPKPHFSLSPYSSMGNNPVKLTDMLGDTTHLYSKNGILIGTINDNLENQVHFMDYEVDKSFEAWTITPEEGGSIDILASGFRESSIAFLGKNSVKSLKDIAMKSAKIDEGGLFSGKEMAFYADVKDTREIIFRELPVSNDIKKKATGDSYPMGEAVNYYNQYVGNIDKLYGIGHTHTRGWFKGFGGQPALKDVSKNISLNNLGRPSGSPGNTDYFMGGVNPNMPRFIASPVGVTIYNAKKIYNPNQNVHSYDFFKK